MVSGVIPVLYSYFTESGALDLDAHQQQIDWVVRGGAAGLTLFGLASEGAALTQAERRTILLRTSKHLSPSSTMLVTVRPDDDIKELTRCVLGSRDRVGLIVQIGRDPAPSIAQVLHLCADHGLTARVDIGLQLAPGLIDTQFSAASLRVHPELLRHINFLKAEYNSVELDSHLCALNSPMQLLVGRQGQNLIDYLRIGAVGVIPGTEMAIALQPVLQCWAEGQRQAAIRAYCVVAPYIDFAMQDLDTVIDLGRSVTSKILGIPLGARRHASGRDPHAFESAVDMWFSYWQTMNAGPM